MDNENIINLNSGHYFLIDLDRSGNKILLGQGAYGRVYSGKYYVNDQKNGQPAVIKVIIMPQSQSAKAKIEEEINKAQDILYEAFETPHTNNNKITRYIVMPNLGAELSAEILQASQENIKENKVADTVTVTVADTETVKDTVADTVTVKSEGNSIEEISELPVQSDSKSKKEIKKPIQVQSLNIDIQKMFHIFLGMAKEVNKAHNNGILHRDIKVENFLYNEKNKKVSLIDFGCSVWKKDNKELSVVGTPVYMAPEIRSLDFLLDRKDRPRFSSQQDIYSLGQSYIMLVYQYFQNLTPDSVQFVPVNFQASTNLKPQLVKNIQLTNPDSDPEIMNELVIIICAMTADQPNERPSLKEIITKLEELSQSLPHKDKNTNPLIFTQITASNKNSLPESTQTPNSSTANKPK